MNSRETTDSTLICEPYAPAPSSSAYARVCRQALCMGAHTAGGYRQPQHTCTRPSTLPFKYRPQSARRTPLHTSEPQHRMCARMPVRLQPYVQRMCNRTSFAHACVVCGCIAYTTLTVCACMPCRICRPHSLPAHPCPAFAQPLPDGSV